MKLYGQNNLENYSMSNWHTTFKTNSPGHTSSQCDLDNNKIKALLLNEYPILKKLKKYKDYEASLYKTMLSLLTQLCLMLYKYLSDLVKDVFYTKQIQLFYLQSMY